MANHFYKYFYFYILALSTFLGFVFFGWTLYFGEFFSDDFTWLWQGQKIGSDLTKMLTYKMSSFFSPVLNAFYAIFFAFFKFKIWVYFFADLIVHILNSFLVGVLIFQFFKKYFAAVLAVFFTAAAGTAYEPLVWVASNLHSWATLFILTSVVSYNHFLNSKRWCFAFFTFIFFILSFLTKEIAIVAPFLLLGVFFVYKKRHNSFAESAVHKLLAIFVFLSTIIYSIFQIIWQSKSSTLVQGVWDLELSRIFRLPIALFDLIIPLNPILTEKIGWLIWLFAFFGFIFIIYKFKNQSVILYGIFWSVISCLPTIFFITEYWWNPLPSRYTYLPRAGIVVFLIGIYVFLSQKSLIKKRIFSFLLLIVLLWQFIFWISVVSREYDYVYQSGRTLRQAIIEINEKKYIEKVIVAPNRPFEGNIAHIVGAFETLSAIKEKNIIFLEENEKRKIEPNQAMLFWNAQTRSYEVEFY